MKTSRRLIIKILVLSLIVAGVDCLVVFRLLPPTLIARALPGAMMVKETPGELKHAFFTAFLGVWAWFGITQWLLVSRGRRSWVAILLPSVCVGLGVVALDIATARDATVIFRNVGILNATNVSENLASDVWIATSIAYAVTAGILRLRNPPSRLFAP